MVANTLYALNTVFKIVLASCLFLFFHTSVHFLTEHQLTSILLLMISKHKHGHMYLQKQKEKQFVSAKIISPKLILGLLVCGKKASKVSNSALLVPYGKANACLPNQGGKKPKKTSCICSTHIILLPSHSHFIA